MKNVLIKNNRISFIIIGGIKLMPKINQVTEVQLKEIMKFKHFFDEMDPVLELISDTTSEAKGKDESDINSYTKRQAVKIVSDTVNKELLEKWVETAKDKKIKDLAKAQIEKIDKTLKDSKEEARK